MGEAGPPAPGPAGGPRRRPLQGGLGDTIGGALVGFDCQVFRATKPPAILVESAKQVRGLSGQDGSMLSIDFPLDVEPDPPVETGDLAPADGLG